MDNNTTLNYAAVAATGALYLWGDNTYGQLGNGTTTSASSPQLVPGIPAVKSVGLGENDVMALDSSGRHGPGDGITSESSATGAPPTFTRRSAFRTSHRSRRLPQALVDNYAIGAAGQVFAWGYNTHGSVGNGRSGCSAGASTCTVVSVLTPTQVAGLSGGYRDIQCGRGCRGHCQPAGHRHADPAGKSPVLQDDR